MLLLVALIRVALLGSGRDRLRTSQHAGGLGGHDEDWAKLRGQREGGGIRVSGMERVGV